MKALDRFLQRYRLRMILPYLKKGARVLDIGSANGALLTIAPPLAEYVGIDPNLEQTVSIPNGKLIMGSFPSDLPSDATFDVITLLAVLEHIPAEQQRTFAMYCSRCLECGGHLLITVPSPIVDKILATLQTVRLIDGMSIDEHYGFDVREVPRVFEGLGLQLSLHRRFQFGLNNLFVFEKVGNCNDQAERTRMNAVHSTPHTGQLN